MATPLETWVDEAAKLTKPERVVYCDGSEAEYQRMIAEMLRAGDSYTLNEKTYPNCYLHRSSPNDVAARISGMVGGPCKDAFAFHPALGTDTVANARSTDTVELDAFSSVAESKELATYLNDAQTSHLQPASHGSHDVLFSLGKANGIVPQSIDLHLRDFIIS